MVSCFLDESMENHVGPGLSAFGFHGVLLFSSAHLKKVGLKKSPKFLANIIQCVHV